jgi:hypothetical protein
MLEEEWIELSKIQINFVLPTDERQNPIIATK